MKFLCVRCDEQMRLLEAGAPTDRGSLSVRYGCPACSHEIRMLTNPWETQIVTSLGVEIRPEAAGESREASSGCPFGGMVREMDRERAARPDGSPDWSREALQRLQNIPEFVRPMAKMGIEHYARENGYDRIDEQVLEEARKSFGM